MEIIGGYSYLIVGIFFIFLLLLLITTGLRNVNSKVLFGAILISGFWSIHQYSTIINGHSQYPILVLELLKNIAWGFLCISLLIKTDSIAGLINFKHKLRWFYVVVLASVLVSVCFNFKIITDPIWLFMSQLIQAISLLVMVEFLYRQGSSDFKWGFKPIAFIISASAIVDFIVYSSAVLLQQLDFTLFAARGVLQIFIAPILLIGIKRFKSLGARIFVSREVVFHSTLLIGLSAYLSLMALTGYYLNYIGQSWSIYSQLTFIVLGLSILIFLFINENIRRKIKVFISKNFFANRYDYRQQWLSLNNGLKNSASDNFYHTALLAISKVFEIEQGHLFVANKTMTLKASLGPPLTSDLWAKCLLQHQLTKTQWIVDIDEYERYPDTYIEGFSFITTLTDQPLKIIVPIINDNSIFGYFVLSRPGHKELLNYEDRDLFITASQQIAQFLILNEASLTISEAKQFDAFNQMSAFLVHDLKNVAGQLALVSANAIKHRHNPEFVDDAFDTVAHSVDKINKMLNQLKKKSAATTENKQTNIYQVVNKLCQQYQLNTHYLSTSEQQEILLDCEKLTNILEHLIQNSQQATGKNGKVDLHLDYCDSHCIISVSDNGCGMSQDFINNRLFKPFDTTKGNAGMGIGAYEAKHFIESLGGEIKVISKVNQGTKISLAIPRIAHAGNKQYDQQIESKIADHR